MQMALLQSQSEEDLLASNSLLLDDLAEVMGLELGKCELLLPDTSTLTERTTSAPNAMQGLQSQCRLMSATPSANPLRSASPSLITLSRIPVLSAPRLPASQPSATSASNKRKKKAKLTKKRRRPRLLKRVPQQVPQQARNQTRTC